MLWRDREDDYEVAQTLRHLSDANRQLDLHEEGIQQAKEALEIYEQLGDTAEQADCLIKLALLSRKDEQLGAAEEAALCAIDLLPETGEQFRVCRSHCALGEIYRSKHETERAIHHFGVALGIAHSFSWHDALFWVHHSLSRLFLDQGRFDDAHTHIERAKSYTANSPYNLGYTTVVQAGILYRQHKFEEARTELLCATDIFKELGAAKNVEDCRNLLRNIEEGLNTQVASGRSKFNCELL